MGGGKGRVLFGGLYIDAGLNCLHFRLRLFFFFSLFSGCCEGMMEIFWGVMAMRVRVGGGGGLD